MTFVVPSRVSNDELSIKLNNFTIRGKSVGGCETCIIIEDLSVAFDMGYRPNKVESINNIFVSHGHADHIGCLHFCHASKRLSHISNPWQIVIPKCYIEPFKILATAVSSLGRGGYPIEFEKCHRGDGSLYDLIVPFDTFSCAFIEGESCDKLDLISNNRYCVSAFEMMHKITSFGYVIYEKRMKLKAEYLGLNGLKLKTLKESGIAIQENIHVPVIAFSGDTQIEAIVSNSNFIESKILIMECTHFLDSPVEEAKSNGHTHFQEFIDNIEKFKNEWIVLTHFSQKYKRIEDINEYIKLIPEEYKKRIVYWI